jgi:hypothetical protein
MTAALDGEDEAYMERALSLAARGLYTTDPNPRAQEDLRRRRVRSRAG